MRARTNLPRQGRYRLRRIEIQPHGADVTVHFAGEELLGKIERKRKYARETRAEVFHYLKVRCDCRTKARRTLRPQILMEVDRSQMHPSSTRRYPAQGARWRSSPANQEAPRPPACCRDFDPPGCCSRGLRRRPVVRSPSSLHGSARRKRDPPDKCRQAPLDGRRVRRCRRSLPLRKPARWRRRRRSFRQRW